MANKHADPEVQIEEALSKSEAFLQKNGKKFLFSLIVIILLMAGYFGYMNYVRIPAEDKATIESFVAQQFFLENNMTKALEGDEVNLGFTAIAEKYSNTNIGNLSNHYAGICLLSLGKYDDAITALLKYKQADGLASQIINAQNIGLTGDAYAQKKEYKKAIEQYKKASEIKNSFTAPYYLKKAGVLMIVEKNNAEAKKCFEKIKTDYIGSFEARNIDKYIGQCI